METISVNISGKTRRERLNWRAYIVAPFVSIVPGVLAGSQGQLYYPPEELSATEDAWNGIPLTNGHPVHSGRHVSARHPKVAEQYQIGVVYGSRFDGRLTGEAWFDETLTRSADARFGTDVYNRLEKGEAIELSTGLFTDNIPVKNRSEYNGREYTHVARNHRPDHLATLAREIGACSVADGCGINVNVDHDDPDHHCAKCEELPESEHCDQCKAMAANVKRTIWQRLGDLLGVNKGKYGNPKSQNTGKFKPMNAGTGQGDFFEAAQRGTIQLSAEDREQGASAKVEAGAGQNPASWVADEAIWERAKAAADKGGYGDEHWAVVAHVYKKMGGAVKEPAPATNANDSNYAGGASADSFLEGSAMDRNATIQWLTTNCDCWKNKDKVLANKDAFTDEDLTRLKVNAEKSALTANALKETAQAFGAPATLTVNEMPAFIKDKIKAKEDEDEEDEEDEEEAVENKRRIKQPPLRPSTLKEWEASMPPEALAIWNAAKNAVGGEREKVINSLEAFVANTRDADKKRIVENRLRNPKASLESLQETLALVGNAGAPRHDAEADPLELLTLYPPAGPTGNSGDNSEDDEPLDTIAVNMDMQVAPGLRARLKATT